MRIKAIFRIPNFFFHVPRLFISTLAYVCVQRKGEKNNDDMKLSFRQIARERERECAAHSSQLAHESYLCVGWIVQRHARDNHWHTFFLF